MVVPSNSATCSRKRLISASLPDAGGNNWWWLHRKFSKSLQSSCAGIKHVQFLGALFLEVGRTILGPANESFAFLHLNIASLSSDAH